MPVEIEEIKAGKPSVRVLRKAARFIRKGAVIVCPTDSGYALAANGPLRVSSLKQSETWVTA